MKIKIANPIMKFLKLGTQLSILAAFGALLWINISPYNWEGQTVSASTSTNAFVSNKIQKEVPALGKVAKIGVPARLKIPGIAVNAPIEKVALTKGGSMGIPKLPSNVAWYQLGPKPGEVGSATMAGHINWWTGAAGAFAKLSKLKPGDKIIVQDDKGVEISFVVRVIRNYNATADVTDVFFSNDGKAHLNLITCSGVWNKKTKQYSKRLVVFAEKE